MNGIYFDDLNLDHSNINEYTQNLERTMLLKTMTGENKR